MFNIFTLKLQYRYIVTELKSHICVTKIVLSNRCANIIIMKKKKTITLNYMKLLNNLH